MSPLPKRRYPTFQRVLGLLVRAACDVSRYTYTHLVFNIVSTIACTSSVAVCMATAQPEHETAQYLYPCFVGISKQNAFGPYSISRIRGLAATHDPR